MNFEYWIAPIIGLCVIYYLVTFLKNICEKSDKQNSLGQNQENLYLSFNDYINFINIINNVYDDIEAVNECNTLIKQNAEVAPNVDEDCKTLSDKHIRYWRITYITRIETKYLLLKDYYDKYRLAFPINSRVKFDTYLSKISYFIDANRK